jgi:LysM repeat protein
MAYLLNGAKYACGLRAALLFASAAWLVACGGTLPSPSAADETPSSSTRPPETATADTPAVPPPEAPAPRPAPPVPAPAAKLSPEARDKQMAILVQAVSALHQEIDRNDARSEELLEENRRLRAEVASLLSDLDKSRSEDQRLEAALQALERDLRAIRTAPPLGDSDLAEDGEPAEAPARAPGRTASGKAKEKAPRRPKRGVYHVTVSGDTLFGIAIEYGVDYRDLARANGIANPEHIEVGQRIFVPERTRAR